MARKKKIICVPRGTAERIAAELNVSKNLVFNALAFRADSQTAELIRRKALSEYGGVNTTKIIF
jgi:hypothetical protein